MKLLKNGIGTIIGLINSLLGAGGGLITVPYLSKQGLSQQKAQATSVFIILPLTAVSTVLYLHKNIFTLKEAIIFLPFGNYLFFPREGKEFLSPRSAQNQSTRVSPK